MSAIDQSSGDLPIAPVTSQRITDAKVDESTIDTSPDPLADAPPEGVGKRLLRPHTIISFLFAIGIVVFLVTRLEIDPRSVWENLKSANPFLLALAFAIYYSTFFIRAFRWRWMLGQAGINKENGYDIPGLSRLVEILLLSWFVNSIVPAKLGDGYRCYLLKKDTGASFSATLGTLLAERLTDLLVLFVTMCAAGLLAFHGDLPHQVSQTMLIGLVLIVIGIIVVGAVGMGRERVQRFVPSRFHGQFENFHSAVFACLRRPAVPTLISLSIWAMDGLRLYVVAAALGADLAFPLALFVALMSALLTTLPITPAGLGVVEAAIIVVLKLVDMDGDMAGSIAVVDRLIGYWSLIVIGLILYVWRLKTEVQGASVPART